MIAHIEHQKGLAFDSRCKACVALLAGPDDVDVPRGRRTGIHLDYPMTNQATFAQLSGNRGLNLTVAFTQAAYTQVQYEMCSRWRRRRKAKLLDEMLHRWWLARIIRDSLKRQEAAS